MSIAEIQNAAGSSAGTNTITITLPLNTTLGNTLIAGIGLPAGVSVVSITDSALDPWIQCSYANSTFGRSEIWMARGIYPQPTIPSGTPYMGLGYLGAGMLGAGLLGMGGGITTLPVVITITLSGATNAFANASEWVGAWTVSPLDQWSQNFSTSASITPQTVTPRTSGDLVYTIGNSAAPISSVTGGWTSLSMGSTTHHAIAYDVLSGSVAPQMHFGTGGTNAWAVAQAAFLPYSGPPLVNPRLQFPEVLVQISTTNNYQAPLEGIGVWTDISSHVMSMHFGPLGREHMLDRVQSTAASFIVNNRGDNSPYAANGAFQSWNQNGFLWNGGLGLKPMNPIKCTAAWQGVTSNEFYGYIQAVTLQIADALNSTAEITAQDILQELSLKYLSSNAYAQLVLTDGGANLAAYYRLGDTPGSYSVLSSADNGTPQNGSLIDGPNGTPAYGSIGPFLYDTNTSLDLTNGTNAPNSGFNTIDNTTEPPTIHNPLGSASVWTIEGWLKWTGKDVPRPAIPALGSSASVAAIPNGVLFDFVDSGTSTRYEVQVGALPITGSRTLLNAVILSVSGIALPLSAAGQPNIFDGNWHHLVWISDSAPSVYIDGIPGATLGLTGSLQSMTVGCPPQGIAGFDPTGGTTYAVGFSGLMSDIAFYKLQLTPAQILNHYMTGMWFQTQEFGASVGSASSARLNKVLAVAGLNPSNILSVPYEFETLLYAETNTVTTTSALNYLQTQTETEPGLIFAGPDGMIHAYNREFQYRNPTSVTSQGVVGDSASVSYHFDGPSLQIAGDDLDIWNDVQVSSGRTGAQLQEWGPGQSSALATSASVNGSRTMQGLTSLQQQYDSDALALAQFYGAIYGTPIDRVTSIALNSQGAGGSNIPLMLRSGLYDRLTVQYFGQTGSTPFNQDSLIESIEHSVDMSDPTWTTTFAMSAYEVLLPAFYLDSSDMDGSAVLVL